MKKQYKTAVVCIAVIVALVGGAAVRLVNENGKNFESEIAHEEPEGKQGKEPGSIRAVISPDEMACTIAMDDAGYVWKWGEGKAKEDAVLIAELEEVVQIVDTGCGSAYALTAEGEVYAWGMNRGWLIDPQMETAMVFPEPVRLQNLSDITKIEAANGQAFAVDREGRLFVWGLGRYKYSTPDYIPSLVDGYEEQTGNVEEIYVGAGDFHFFKRKDSQIFSIMMSEQLTDDLSYFIVPNFTGEPAVSDWLSDIRAGKSERIFDIRLEGGPRLVYLYEMGKKEDVALISADAYTMYLYQKDGTLWYWNSDRITYHDKERAGASVELRDLDYRGVFEEIDIGKILDMESDSVAIPKIISASPCKDGVMFLLENGEVFVSEYVTTEIRDVEYFARNYDNPQSTWTAVAHDLPLKGLSFRKLDYENIVSISSNKNDRFYLVDKLGNTYCYQAETEEPSMQKRVVRENTSEVGGHETENTNYALYPSTIVETDPKNKPPQFIPWETTIELTFPQIYYSNEYGDYQNSDIETAINQELFHAMGNMNYLADRDTRLLRENRMDYEITKADDELISIKYCGTSLSVSHEHDICQGITIDIQTGEKVALSEIITLSDNLVERVESGEIQMSSPYDWETSVECIEEFYEDYRKGLRDNYTCYYLEEDAVNLVISILRGNSHYFNLRIPLE